MHTRSTSACPSGLVTQPRQIAESAQCRTLAVHKQTGIRVLPEQALALRLTDPDDADAVRRRAELEITQLLVALCRTSPRGWLARSGSSAGPEHLHDSGGRGDDAGGPDDWCECREDLVNSLHADSGLAAGSEVHQLRLGRRVERHEGGQPDEHQRIVIEA